jgi:DNA-binding NarL/FixJ family response regulator
MARSIRVLICDDHAVVRAALRALLDAQPDIEVVGEAAAADEAVELTARLAPDVVVLDIVMPGRSAVDAVPDLLAAAPGVHVLMLSMQDDPAYVQLSFAAGASGYVPKAAADVELVHALRDVAAGHMFVDPSLGARLAIAADELEPPEEDALSGREHDVLRLLALGHTNQEIASMLAISVRTVETHRAHIVHKLGLKTRAELVRYAIATGQLEAPEHATV